MTPLWLPLEDSRFLFKMKTNPSPLSKATRYVTIHTQFGHTWFCNLFYIKNLKSLSSTLNAQNVPLILLFQKSKMEHHEVTQNEGYITIVRIDFTPDTIEALFCTPFRRGPFLHSIWSSEKAKKKDTHGVQKKKWRKFLISSFLFGSFFYKRFVLSMFLISKTLDI